MGENFSFRWGLFTGVALVPRLPRAIVRSSLTGFQISEAHAQDFRENILHDVGA